MTENGGNSGKIGLDLQDTIKLAEENNLFGQTKEA